MVRNSELQHSCINEVHKTQGAFLTPAGNASRVRTVLLGSAVEIMQLMESHWYIICNYIYVCYGVH